MPNDMTPSAPKRILFCFFRQEIHRIAVKDFLAKRDFEFVGLISHENYVGDKVDLFMKIKEVYHNSLFENNQSSAMPPKEIIEALFPVESTCLKMAERRQKNPWLPRQYEVRKRQYLEQLCYAYAFLKEHQFDRVIYSHIPHNTFDYIFFFLCKEMGVNISFFHQTQVQSTFIHSESTEGMFDPIYDYLESDEMPENVELPEYLEGEIAYRKGEGVPFYMNTKAYDNKTRLYMLQKKIFRRDTYTKPIQGLTSMLAYTCLKKVNKPPAEKYIYFALHMQPEMTTSPCGGIFVDQYFAILYLARSLPPGIMVVVKENPIQIMAYREPEFYKGLAKEKNITFATKKTSTFALIENSIAVATITGTVGWEAVFKQKPVFVFGYIFYQKMKGVVKVTQQEDIRSAVESILNGTFEVSNDADVRRFLFALCQTSYKGIFEQEYLITTTESVEEHAESVLQAFEEVI